MYLKKNDYYVNAFALNLALPLTQAACFEEPLSSRELARLRTVLSEETGGRGLRELPSDGSAAGVTEDGFLALFCIFVARHQFEVRALWLASCF